MSAILTPGNHSSEHQHGATPDHLAIKDAISADELNQHHSSGVPHSLHADTSWDPVGHVAEHAGYQPLQDSSEVSR